MAERYSPEEIKQVLARVAELSAADERGGSMTRQELVRIATEAGFDDELVTVALAELDPSDVDVQLERSGATTLASCEVSRRLGREERKDLSARLAHEFGAKGEWTQVPDGWSWRGQGQGCSMQLTLRLLSTGSLVRLEMVDKRGGGLMMATALILIPALIVLLNSVAVLDLGTLLIVGLMLFLFLLFAGNRVRHALRRRERDARAAALLGDSLKRLPLPAHLNLTEGS